MGKTVKYFKNAIAIFLILEIFSAAFERLCVFTGWSEHLKNPGQLRPTLG